ncbi:MAG: hypothetical protein ACFFD3_11150 [Candidatus Thorarchaeota archaeon]
MTERGLADKIAGAQSPEDLGLYLQKISVADIVADEAIRTSLRHQSNLIACLIHRNYIEGRTLPLLHWISAYPEFLLENRIQENLRRLGIGNSILDCFIDILNSRDRTVLEHKEAIRAIGSIHGISDLAWHSLYRSPLMGLISSLELTDSFARLLALIMKISSVIKNREILDIVNKRSPEIVESLEGKKNPDLARGLLCGYTFLCENPWKIDKISESKVDSLAPEIVDALLLKMIQMIPEPATLNLSENEGNQPKLLRIIERSIDRLGWPFVQHYLRFITQENPTATDWFEFICKAMGPMGQIDHSAFFLLIKEQQPIPRQIMQTALGTPEEYVISFELLEEDGLIDKFETDCIQLEDSIPTSRMQIQHFENARTGIGLEEALAGDQCLVRLLLQHENETGSATAVDFLKGVLVSNTLPIKVKKSATHWLKQMKEI